MTRVYRGDRGKVCGSVCVGVVVGERGRVVRVVVVTVTVFVFVCTVVTATQCVRRCALEGKKRKQIIQVKSFKLY